MNIYRSTGKRGLDLILGLIIFILGAPVIIICSILVISLNGRPIIYKQDRAGLKGKIFVLLKFRTMINIHSGTQKNLPDRMRLTKLGKFLRNTSLDELPSIYNVIKGELSLIGPRPLLPKYTNRYSKYQKRRLDVKPGLTGWAQINGRNAISWDEKFKLDIWYVKNQSLILDLKIIVLTIIKVLKNENISQPGHATMEKFRGNN